VQETVNILEFTNHNCFYQRIIANIIINFTNNPNPSPYKQHGEKAYKEIYYNHRHGEVFTYIIPPAVKDKHYDCCGEQICLKYILDIYDRNITPQSLIQFKSVIQAHFHEKKYGSYFYKIVYIKRRD